MIRRRLQVDGIVQGVGFRPFVTNLARDEQLTGFVTNNSAGVVIEVQGPLRRVDAFSHRLRSEAPPLALIVTVDAADIATGTDNGFVILASQDTPGTSTLVPPDVATCADCLREILDPGDRRRGYAFTNCTNCGPRWTIIGRIPYDRPFTSMAIFEMCPACRREYEDPSDRRFHAQPNACPECGPMVWVTGAVGATDSAPGALGRVAETLARHGIVAIKGLGGFHLAVRADKSEAVAELRRRKNRAGKPLALMARDLASARLLCRISPEDEALLTSPAAPIVLMERLPAAPVAAEVAPGHRRLGVMLPPTPLHHLLFGFLATHGISALVMTSGNVSDEPICIANEEAEQRLAGIADAWCLHDRDILRRVDDSVVQVVRGKPLMFRRSRGYSPVPVFVRGLEGAPPVLAVGPDLKNTVCLLKDGRAFVSPHIGNLSTLQAVEFHREMIATLQDVLECEPCVIAHDMHPDYAATRWARRQAGKGRRLVAVQHHHAHLVAVQAEHGLAGPAVGLIMDGTGYGTDGTIWGGEILVGDASGFKRAGHFDQVPLPGGDAAIRAPWRQAVSYLRHAYGDDFFVENHDEFLFQSDRPLLPLLEMLGKDLNCPRTSSCGRLFDAVAAMIGPWTDVTYEAQAAIELMSLTDGAEVAKAQTFDTVLEALQNAVPSAGSDEAPLVLPTAAFIRSVRDARRAGMGPAGLSAMFHRTLIEVLGRAAAWTAVRYGLGDVILGGGVFQNEILLAGLEEYLTDEGLRVWRPHQVPPGDGGISLGQAVVAARSG